MSDYVIGTDMVGDLSHMSVFIKTDDHYRHPVGCDCHERESRFLADALRMQTWMDSQVSRAMGFSDKMVNQSMELNMKKFAEMRKEMQALHEQGVAELRDAAKAAVDEAVKEHGTKALLVPAPRIESDSFTGMYFATMAQEATKQELETRRKLLFQKAAETKNEEENEQLPS